MRKGFISTAALILMGFTVILGTWGAEAIKEATPPCDFKVTIFLRDMESGLLSEALDHNTNISGQVTYALMPDSLAFRTQEDIVYSRADGEIIYGYLTDDEFKDWMGCKK